ncbi:hypothetical protein CsSME_00013410 [Camellia sinensis var. sinensis]
MPSFRHLEVVIQFQADFEGSSEIHNLEYEFKLEFEICFLKYGFWIFHRRLLALIYVPSVRCFVGFWYR